MTDLLNAALEYATRGWAVLPLHNIIEKDGVRSCTCSKDDCGSPGKHPRTRNGLKDASIDPEQITKWWKRHPAAHIGLRTGADSGLVVLDVDPDHGGETTLEELQAEYGELPTIARALTGGAGWHYLFAHPGVEVRNDASKKLGAGLDVRGDGGYIVAAPSGHISGGQYEWLALPEKGVAPPEVPEWMLERIRKADPPAKPTQVPRPRRENDAANTKYGLKALDGEISELRNAVQGHRNVALIKAALQLLELANGGELEHHLVISELTAAATSIGLPLAEIETTIDSAQRKVGGAVRVAPPPKITPGAGARKEIPNEPDPPPPGGPDDGHEPSTPNAPSRPRTDMGNAERLVDNHGHELRHVRLWGKWLCWDGTRWARDETGRTVERAKTVVRSIYTEAATAGSDNASEALAKHAIQSEKVARIKAMIDLASSDEKIAVTPDELDADQWVLNVRNGTIDLQTGELRPHSQADLLTHRVNVTYDEKAACPQWIAFLDWAMQGDQELINYLQRAVGYSLTGSIREQVLFFLHGGGDNGKSTFLGVLLTLLGEYATQTEPELLMARRGEAHPTGLADLAGKRLAMTVEIEEGRHMAESLVKSITGEKRIKARFMRQDFFEFTPTHKLWLAGNHKPKIRGTDRGIWRRIRLIPWLNTITDAEKDVTLGDKLEAELPGILTWAVVGCLAWQHYGLVAPASVLAATDDYRAESDLFGAFLEDTCETDPEGTVTSADLYEAYTRWAERNGHKKMASNTFGAKLAERDDLHDVRLGRHRARAWQGIRLKSIGDPGPTEPLDYHEQREML